MTISTLTLLVAVGTLLIALAFYAWTVWQVRHAAPEPPPAPAPYVDVLTEFAERWRAASLQISNTLTPALRDTVRTMSKAFAAFSPVVAANEVVHVAGLEARYFVRAGLDPAYATAQARDALVFAVLAGTAQGCAFLTEQNRALVAGAVLNGWETRGLPVGPVPVLAWHREMGATRVLLGRSA